MKKIAPIVIIFAMFAGCQDAFDVENLDPVISSIDPIYNDNGLLRINFTLNDFEGDDTAVVFQVCESGATNCGFGELVQNESDPLARLHTVPKKTHVAHSIAWDFSCGRLSENGERIESDDQKEYIVKLNIKGQNEETQSESFTLQGLNLQSSTCEKLGGMSLMYK